MIDLADDKMRNRLRKSFDPDSVCPTTDYADKHTHLVNLYLDYLLTNYPPKKNEETGEKKGEEKGEEKN